MSRGTHPDGPSVVVLIAVSALVLVLAVGVLVVVALRDRGGSSVAQDGVAAPPSAVATPAVAATRTATVRPTPVTATTSATGAPDDPGLPVGGEDATAREPSPGDAADFAVTFRPEGATSSEAVAADLDGDGSEEVVVASVVGGRTRLDVARWSGTAYELTPVQPVEGGPADALERVAVRDIDGTPDTREIVTYQTAAPDRRSLSVWAWDGTAVVGLEAVEGCWAGSHTYGVVGATLQSTRITASCDGSPEPQSEWPSDVYVYDPEQGTFVYELTEVA